MDTTVGTISFAAFLQENVGLSWSFLILAAVTVLGWFLKTALEYFKSIRLHDQEIRYEMGRDLLAARFESYERLWQQTADLAIYSDSKFSSEDAEDLADKLSDWYFSGKGGLYLTDSAKDFYFTLQDMLVLLSRDQDWRCLQRPRDPRAVFEHMLESANLSFPHDLNEPTSIDHAAWRRFCTSELVSVLKTVLSDSAQAEAGERAFAALQQISSVMRSNLTAELESRLDIDRPNSRRNRSNVV